MVKLFTFAQNLARNRSILQSARPSPSNSGIITVNLSSNVRTMITKVDTEHKYMFKTPQETDLKKTSAVLQNIYAEQYEEHCGMFEPFKDKLENSPYKILNVDGESDFALKGVLCDGESVYIQVHHTELSFDNPNDHNYDFDLSVYFSKVHKGVDHGTMKFSLKQKTEKTFEIIGISFIESSALAIDKGPDGQAYKESLTEEQPITQLDPAIEMAASAYLAERGFNTQFALYLKRLYEHKIEREYVHYITSIHNFLGK